MAKKRCKDRYLYYRYGEPKDRAKAQAILSGPLRAATVSSIMDRLSDWRSSPFEHEGECVHAFRSFFCTAGHSWDVAHEEASNLVNEALRAIGAKRPSWEEAQRWYALTAEQCRWCAREIPELVLTRFRGVPYCSTTCAGLALEHHDRGQATKQDLTYQYTLRFVTAQARPTRECRQCNQHFHPKEDSQAFCSKACISESLKRVADRHCKHCGGLFRPLKRHGEFCSKKCSTRSRYDALPVKPCEHCGTEFKMTNPGRKYCSTRCLRIMAARYEKERRKGTRRPGKVVRLTIAVFDDWFREAA